MCRLNSCIVKHVLRWNYLFTNFFPYSTVHINLSVVKNIKFAAREFQVGSSLDLSFRKGLSKSHWSLHEMKIWINLNNVSSKSIETFGPSLSFHRWQRWVFRTEWNFSRSITGKNKMGEENKRKILKFRRTVLNFSNRMKNSQYKPD